MSKLKDLLKLKTSLEEASLTVPADLLSQISEEEEKEAKKNNGCVYILRNKYMPDIVNFAYAITPNFKEFELAIHSALASCRVNYQREFFKISPQNAFNTFLNHSAKYNVTPILYSNDGISILEDYERLTKGRKKHASPQQSLHANFSGTSNETGSNGQMPKQKRLYDKTIYSWDGITFYTKSRFVFEIAARILRENPDYTYQHLLDIMPLHSATNKTLILASDLRDKSDDSKKRYVKETLTTCDGKTFLVSTQWGIPEIESKIYPLLDKLGYSYSKISSDELSREQNLFKGE